MNVRGAEVSFVVDIEGIDDYFEGEVLNTIEEVFEDAREKIMRLRPEESVVICIGEVDTVTNEFGMVSSLFPIADMDELTEDLKKEILEMVEELVPEQQIKEFPKIVKPIKGNKKIPRSEIAYLCKACNCESTLCSGANGFYKVNANEVEYVSKRMVCAKKTHKEELFCPICANPLVECECSEWPEEVFMVDSNMVRTISILNKKGYLTKGCCEGHEAKGYASIVLAVHYNIMVPDNWFWSFGNSMSYAYGRTGETFEEEKKRVIEELEKWADELPVCIGAF